MLFDVILLLSFFLLFLIGFHKGFLYILLHFISLYVSIYTALKFNKPLASFLKHYFNASGFLIKGLSFLFIVLFIVSLFSILHRLIDFFLRKRKKLELTNKIAGAITGILIGIFGIYMLIKYEGRSPLLQKIVSDSVIIKESKKILKIQGNNFISFINKS